MGFLGNLFGRKQATGTKDVRREEKTVLEAELTQNSLFEVEQYSPTPDVQTKLPGYVCNRCNKALQAINMSRGGMTFGSSMPTLYDGVVCNNCKKVECIKCKGTPAEAACSWCGGAVSPAFNLAHIHPVGGDT